MGSQGQLTVYRDSAPVVDVRYETDEDTTLVETLVTALAEAEGVDVTALPSLYAAVDLDHLTQLFKMEDGVADATSVLAFEFRQWDVFVRGDGHIRVCDQTRPTEVVPVFDGPIWA